MRNNREKWQFYSHPSKPALNAADARYWKESMRKLLKVGIEFEFNLPDQKGSCKGDSVQCPCVRIDSGCWKECTNMSSCQKEKCYDTCTIQKKKCALDKCKKCNKHEFSCIGSTCVDFVSACFTCNNFDKNCGSCNKKYDPSRDPKHIRQNLNVELQPSKTYGKVSPSGVVGITTDGSLLGDKGVEIITVGRRVDFWEFYTMSKRILDKVEEYGAYLNERTGSHMHVLTSYYEGDGANELEKSMPQIVLANFHQLCRRYQNALTWITIALSDPRHMTRWEKFRVSILDASPVTKGMKHVIEDVSRNAGGNKYGFINYNRTRFQGEDIDRFHIEFRQADSTMCPTYYAALACLHYAVVVKAVEISRYGLLKVGDEAWLKKAKSMKNVILNGCGDYNDSSRMSDTRHLLDNTQYFIEESLDLVNQLKSILLKIGPAYGILIKLAERPVSLRLMDGKSWKEIEQDLAVEMKSTDQLEIKLSEIIDLRLIDDCVSSDEWVIEVQKCLSEDEDITNTVSTEEIELFVNTKMREGEMIWSDSTGCMMSV